MGKRFGIDLGDKVSHFCVLNAEGDVIEEGQMRHSEASLLKHFADLVPTRIALETGTQSGWISRLLSGFGHEVLVANARELRGITASDRKNDRNDAEKLARYARLDPALLCPVQLRTKQQQLDLGVLRSRDALVRARTLLVNAARGLAKSHGERLPSSITATFGQRAEARLSEVLSAMLRPLLMEIDSLTKSVAAYEATLAASAEDRYPETQLLRSVPGVGPITALTFVLTLSDKGRFAHSRDVGAYLGLCPKQQQSGERQPQLGITRSGNGYLRRLLVRCAHYILGHFGADSALRQWGLRMAERGGSNARKRAIVAVARKLSVVLHRPWVTGQNFLPFTVEQNAATVA